MFADLVDISASKPFPTVFVGHHESFALWKTRLLIVGIVLVGAAGIVGFVVLPWVRVFYCLLVTSYCRTSNKFSTVLVSSVLFRILACASGWCKENPHTCPLQSFSTNPSEIIVMSPEVDRPLPTGPNRF